MPQREIALDDGLAAGEHAERRRDVLPRVHRKELGQHLSLDEPQGDLEHLERRGVRLDDSAVGVRDEDGVWCDVEELRVPASLVLERGLRGAKLLVLRS